MTRTSGIANMAGTSGMAKKAGTSGTAKPGAFYSGFLRGNSVLLLLHVPPRFQACAFQSQITARFVVLDRVT